MNFKMAMVLVFGIVLSVAWVSTMSTAADHWPTEITVQSQAVNH